MRRIDDGMSPVALCSAKDPGFLRLLALHLWSLAFILKLTSWCKMEGASAAIMSPFQGESRRKRGWSSFKKLSISYTPPLVMFQTNLTGLLLTSPTSVALGHSVTPAWTLIWPDSTLPPACVRNILFQGFPIAAETWGATESTWYPCKHDPEMQMSYCFTGGALAKGSWERSAWIR